MHRPFSIGRVERRMADFAKDNGITLASNSVYMSVKSITHSRRKSKQEKDLIVSDNDLIGFHSSRRRMDLCYDGNKFAQGVGRRRAAPVT